MKLGKFATLFTTLLTRPSVAADLSTPQSALKALEAAFIAKDIEAAVTSKNFYYEARAMLVEVQGVAEPDPEVIVEIAKALDLSFRKQMKEDGFPKFAGLKCRVLSTKQLAPGLVEMAEEIEFPDGHLSQEIVHAALSGEAWGIVVLPSK